MNKIDVRRLVSHDQDLALWAAEQSALIRAGKMERVDQENLAEEIASLGSSQESEIENRMTVLLAHLLKWEFQPARRSNSRRATLLEQRTRIARVVAKSPSLRNYPESSVSTEYPIARLHASGETGLDESAFPPTCPYPISKILDPKFLPGRK